LTNVIEEYTVVGKGDSDFGTFVLSGSFFASSRVLEIQRKYIYESDPRSTIEINELKLVLEKNDYSI
jgi:hypothetical protein